jgi:hypothetical protein
MVAADVPVTHNKGAWCLEQRAFTLEAATLGGTPGLPLAAAKIVATASKILAFIPMSLKC